jgi:tetratricopeptide (TPR) repeat protein
MERALGGGRKRGRGRCVRQLISRCLLPTAYCLLLTASGLLSTACRSRALLEQAQQAWDAKDYAGAAAHYEEFVKSSPQHERAPEAHFNAANIYFLNLKRYDRAAAHYVHIIENFPASPHVYKARLRLAECYAAEGKWREAINEYENILKFFAGTGDRRRIRLEIADIYYEQDLSQALVEYQKVVKDAPYDELSERAYLRIGGIRVLRDEFTEAIPAYRAVEQNTQDDGIRRQARYGLADCYERVFDFDAAVKVLEQTAPDPQNPDYLQKRIAGIRERQRQRRLIQPEAFGPQKK